MDSNQQDGQKDGRNRKRRRRRRRSGGGGGSDGGGGGGGGQDQSGGGSQGAEPREQSGGDRESAGKPRRKRTIVDPSEITEKGIFSESSFADLGLSDEVNQGLEEVGFRQPTAIQGRLIPPVLEGRDVLGQAKTGSGKTAAFGLPLLSMIEPGVEFQAIILCPTRELAMQIDEELRDLGRFTKLRSAPIYGGQPIPRQVAKLEKGPEILVATPGRFMDMKERGYLHVNNVRHAVLDEVDRMLDIGFRDDIRKILRSVKTDHQTIFVSATISDEIDKLARSFMRKDVERIETSSGSLTVELVEQHHLPVARWDKKQLLLHLLTHEEPALTLVFCRTKRSVDSVAEYLRRKGVDAHAIHGDLPQGKRNEIMNKFRDGALSALIASDLAARGIDVDRITHVINYDLPEDSEIYIHRIGRTARAGQRGIAWSFVAPEEGNLLTEIEKLANTEIPKMEYPDFKPGPVPADIVARQQAEETHAAKSAEARVGKVALPVDKGQVDEKKFPGGVVPSKLPPRTFGGRAARRGR